MSTITCLGRSFDSQDERRAYFRDELRKWLPSLKQIEGYPIGEDEDIVKMSDPPYYTACPNPWLSEILTDWESKKPAIVNRTVEFKVVEPYASDVSEGKYDPTYLYHPYPTKVPFKAITRFLLHYTQPGDIVLDGFAGTGMTGLAAQLCGRPDAETKYKIEKERRDQGMSVPVWGARRAVLGDLSPLASFIAYNYNTSVDIDEFEKQAIKILDEINHECGWMFETTHINGQKGSINYTVWSDVFACSSCNGEIVFWDSAVSHDSGKVNDEFSCPSCGTNQTKRSVEKVWKTTFDTALNAYVRQVKSVPVYINYTTDGKRFEKKADKVDLALVEKIEELTVPYWFPVDRMPEGDESRRNDASGITNVHQFYTKRNLYVLASVKERLPESIFNVLITKVAFQTTKLYRLTYQNGVWGAGGGPLSGTLFVPSLIKELCVINQITAGLKGRRKLQRFDNLSNSAISLKSATSQGLLEDNCIDYIFTDPPFGANLMYSELNFITESWLKIRTNNKSEAIENKTQKKSLLEYQQLMEQCFKEYFRVLKPGKWMSVEFSNTNAAVWNGIQTALQRAGFIISNVAALDKQKESFKAVTTPTAVKQDLVISCYKPTIDFEHNFNTHTSEVGVWDFVREHLAHLPIHLRHGLNTAAIVERSPKILYDRMITFFLMRSRPIPLDASAFQQGLKQRFAERDGMMFLSDQASDYDSKKASAPTFVQLSFMVTTEDEGVQWLRQQLSQRAYTYQELHPRWMQAITAIRKGDILPELRDLLHDNFIEEEDHTWRLPDINEAHDRDALRLKGLLREFESYIQQLSLAKSKKLKVVRAEALRAGFRACYERQDFATIVLIAGNMPQTLLLEDEQLLMYFDIAQDRV